MNHLSFSFLKYSMLIAVVVIIFLPGFSQDVETVRIGDQVWMKHNLDINVLGSTCYDEDSLNCETYGRLYAWPAAIDACPEGFRLPTDEDWRLLTEALGGEEMAGRELMAGGATGFDALLGGNFQPEVNMYSFKDLKGYYWSATPKGMHTAWIRIFSTGQAGVTRDHIGKSFFFSIRCIQVR